MKKDPKPDKVFKSFSKQELLQLLEISSAITKAKTPAELLGTIREKVMRIIPFYDTGILIVEPDGLHHYDMAVNIQGWDNSEGNLQLQQNESSFKIPHSGSYVEFVMKKIEQKGEPILEDYEAAIKKWSHPFFSILKKMRYKKAIVALLTRSDRTYGTLWLNSLDIDGFNEKQFPLFVAIAEQVSIAVANILSQQELQEEKTQKEVLLQISESIAAIQDRKELFTTIFKKIQPIIPMDDTAIVVLNENGSQWMDWTNIDNYQASTAAAALNEEGFTNWNPMDDMTRQSLLKTGIFTIEQYIKANHAFAKAMYENGLREFMYTPLICQGKTIGSLYFDSNQHGTYSNRYFSMFRAIADMIAVAVNNIITKEEILEREKEKTLLLSVSEAVAKIQNKKQLLKVVYEKIQPIFPFDSAGLFITNTETDAIYEILDNETWPDELQKKLTGENSLEPWVLSSFNAKSWWMKEEITILPMQQEGVFASGTACEIQFTEGIAYGLKHFIGGPMYANGKKIGAICFNSKQENFYNTSHLSMFKSISEQVSVAVANILANEEIIRRDQEKNFLILLSQTLNTKRTIPTFLQAIVSETKSIFNFYDTGIFLINNKTGTYLDLSVVHTEVDDSRVNHALNQKGYYRDGGLALAGSAIEFILNKCKKEPTFLFDFNMDCSAFSDLALVADIKEMGYQVSWFCPLVQNGETVGLVSLNYPEKEKLPMDKELLFVSIADKIGSTLVNILANEEIIAREKEKSQLLEITTLIAQVKDASDLLHLIVEKIKPIFHFYDCGLFVLSADGKTHTDLAAVLPGVSPSDWNKSIAEVSVNIPHYGSCLEVIMDKIALAGRPLLLDFIELEKQFPDYPQFKEGIIQELGYRDCLAFHLIVRGKSIGMFCINALEKDFFRPSVHSIFQSVTESISIAVANILANEEILEREKEKAQLLSISEKLATIRDKKGLFDAIFKEVNSIFSFDTATVAFYDDKLEFTQHYSSAYHENYKSNAHYKNILSTPTPTSGNPHGEFSNFEKSKIISYEYLAKNYPHHEGVKVMRDYQLVECVIIPLRYGNKLLATFEMHSKTKNTFSEKFSPLYDNLANQLAAAIANILANEEIILLNKQLEAQNAYLVEEVEQQYNFDEMIGQNPKFTEVCKNIGLVAKTDTTVLILGETGTGKELVARAIHNNSPRKSKPLIKLNCAALPANLVESELFGHERGSFTGAFERRIGKFELASGSTLFLDEVGELPLELQAKLLRALQEKEIERLGSNKTIKVDVRIIAATNRDLHKEVKAGKFRQDLFYRLHIFPINLPPLRERKEDIPLLATHFIHRYAQKNGKRIQGLSNKALQEVMSYNWPGNIRELEHMIERSVIISNSKLIQDMNLPDVSKMRTSTAANEFVIKTWQEQERDYILEVLKFTNGNVKGKGGAAELLQLPPTTLQSKMNKLGIKRKHFLEQAEK